jgi:uncharacterized RDD family membrane protein YckC
MVVFGDGTAAHSAPLAVWWERLAAAIVDGVIVGFSLFFLLFIVFGLTRRSHLVTADHRSFYTSLPTAFIVASVIGALAGLVYFALLDGGTSGQTVGKRVMNIAVICQP